MWPGAELEVDEQSFTDVELGLLPTDETLENISLIWRRRAHSTLLLMPGGF